MYEIIYYNTGKRSEYTELRESENGPLLRLITRRRDAAAALHTTGRARRTNKRTEYVHNIIYYIALLDCVRRIIRYYYYYYFYRRHRGTGNLCLFPQRVDGHTRLWVG